uniref:Uncharacterized protein n=1 Tax=Arundo donax TaxID=35708 RepID=A0A0A9A6N7_ARUDO
MRRWARPTSARRHGGRRGRPGASNRRRSDRHGTRGAEEQHRTCQKPRASAASAMNGESQKTHLLYLTTTSSFVTLIGSTNGVKPYV